MPNDWTWKQDRMWSPSKVLRSTHANGMLGYVMDVTPEHGPRLGTIVITGSFAGNLTMSLHNHGEL